MSEALDCADCGKHLNCGCGQQPDGTTRYEWQDHSHFGSGLTRCFACSEAFRKAWQEKEWKEELERKAAHLEANHEDGRFCPECCEHEFDADEGYHCLNCGTDGSAQVISELEDRAKDYRKYGDT